ncbi:MAG: hypothetical protein KAV99_02095 [Candidatus Latescibacteria bacterium]|nr:hypothetical protein [Candidatus Latescibacterota bacterium]
MWSDWSKSIAGSCGFRYNSQAYNYRREYLAPNGYGDLNLRWRVNPRLSLGVTVNNTTEFKPDGSIQKISWISHPTLGCALSKELYLRVWSEPNTDTHIHRLNLLFSWNFMPKSWVYVAFNESRDNTQENWRLKDRIIVAKVRYLFLL